MGGRQGTTSRKQGFALGVAAGRTSKAGLRSSSPSNASSAWRDLWGPLHKRPCLWGLSRLFPEDALAQSRLETHTGVGEEITAHRRLRTTSFKPSPGGDGAGRRYTRAHQS